VLGIVDHEVIVTSLQQLSRLVETHSVLRSVRAVLFRIPLDLHRVRVSYWLTKSMDEPSNSE